MSAKRINPETGVFEEDNSVFGGVFGHDWQAMKNDDNNQERINPDDGVHEEDTSIFGGIFGHDWQPKK
jgi:uncharacterized protein (UPF0210 family)